MKNFNPKRLKFYQIINPQFDRDAFSWAGLVSPKRRNKKIIGTVIYPTLDTAYALEAPEPLSQMYIQREYSTTKKQHQINLCYYVRSILR